MSSRKYANPVRRSIRKELQFTPEEWRLVTAAAARNLDKPAAFLRRACLKAAMQP